ncbi:hypothetical protein K440DRAFT_684304, partial [Wilcoxina mikolae CBS 423.85]
MLREHNDLRREHHVPPLTWNPYLASRAQDWADRCDKVHSGVSSSFGENLGANYRDVGHVCHTWGRNERPLYDYAAGVMTPKTDTSRRWFGKAHGRLDVGSPSASPKFTIM